MKINNVLYFDHQATTPVDPDVMRKMEPFFTNEFGNPHSAEHYMGWTAAKAVDDAKAQIANIMDVTPDEIIFTSGATEANNIALLGLLQNRINKKRKILISRIEHKSVIEPCLYLQEKLGYEVIFIPVDKNGIVDLKILKNIVDDETAVISIMAVNNEIGSIQPIEQIAEIAQRYDVPFHCDATQAPCALDISRITEYVDSMSLSGHKIYGPKGIGLLYLSQNIRSKITPITFGGSQQSSLRPGTIPTPLVIGMAAALEFYKTASAETERIRISKLRDLLLKKIVYIITDVCINGPQLQYRHPGNLNIRFNGHSAHDILAGLQPKVAASTGSACNSGNISSSYVLEAIGLTEEETDSSVRFCVGRYTTEDDVTELVNLLTCHISGVGV